MNTSHATSERVANAAIDDRPLRRYWRRAEDGPFEEPVFVMHAGEAQSDLAKANVVALREGEPAARAWLAAGADRVLFADDAVTDTRFIRRMVEAFGSEQVGVYLPVRRMQVSWSLDFTSNADFRCLTPSIGRPTWEVLRADGSRTGIDALWWLGEMHKQGAGSALLGVDYQDRDDYSIAAEMVERFGNWLWFSALAQDEPSWNAEGWTLAAKVRRLVLPLPAAAIEDENGGVA